MKSTGIVRKVNKFGHLVLPNELRYTLDIGDDVPFEIFIESQKLILRKYAPDCVFCGGMDELITFKGKAVCRKCIQGFGKPESI